MEHLLSTFIVDMLDNDQDIAINLIDCLQLSMIAESNNNDAITQYTALCLHLDAHMEFEEHLMARFSYRLASVHTQDHRAFMIQVHSIINGVNTSTVSKHNVSSLLKKVHKHHVKYHDNVLRGYFFDKYALDAVHDGEGI